MRFFHVCKDLELACHACGATVKLDCDDSTVRFVCKRTDVEIAEEFVPLTSSNGTYYQ